MLEAVRSFKRSIDTLDRIVRGVRGARIDRTDIRDSARAIVDEYFRGIRGSVVGTTPDDVIQRCDSSAHALLQATHHRSATATYRTAIKDIQQCALDLEKSALLTATSSQVAALDPADQRIIDTLRSLLPSAALSYEQAILDLRAPRRLSWRGPATDLREALRETLDHLAPDKDVTAQPGFKLEPDTKGPTMKQKVRYILRKRDLSSAAVETSESAVVAVDAAVGTFVRSVYTRSSTSTHTPTERGEVLRVRDLVRVALRELLAIE